MKQNIHPDTFIAPSADIVDAVNIGEGSSIWYNAVLRGDMAPITIGRRTNIQDGCLLHVATPNPLIIGDDVTAGHGAILHGCTIENGCMIGMGAIILNGAVIGEGSIIAAGALVPQNKVIPPGSLVMGIPGKIVRQLEVDEIEDLLTRAEVYVRLWKERQAAKE